MQELTLDQAPFGKKIYRKHGLISGGAVAATAAVLGGSWLIDPSPASGIAFAVFVGAMTMMSGVFGAQGIRLDFDRAMQGVGKSIKERLLVAAREEYGVELHAASLESLLEHVKFSKDGRLKVPADGGVMRFGKAMQMDDRQYLYVQLVWDGAQFLLVNLEEGPTSMTELVSRKEDVSF